MQYFAAMDIDCFLTPRLVNYYEQFDDLVDWFMTPQFITDHDRTGFPNRRMTGEHEEQIQGSTATYILQEKTPNSIKYHDKIQLP